MRKVFAPLGVFVLWMLGAGLALQVLPPMAAIAVLAVLFALFLRLYLLHPWAPRRWAELRLRPLRGEALRATLAAVPVVMVLSWAGLAVWVRLVSLPPQALDPFDFLTGTAGGRLALALVAVVAAPLLEELVFRGLVQGALERRRGPSTAILLTSSIFAVFHWLPTLLPLYLFLGAAFGYAVWATRSIWAGVLLHAANNSVAVLQMGAEPPELPPTVWETGWTPELGAALAVLAGAALVGARVAGWMRRAGRGPRGG